MTPASFDKSRLNKIYIQLAKLYHPDAHNDSVSPEECNRRFKKVVEAHEILKSDDARRKWDIRNNRSVHHQFYSNNFYHQNPNAHSDSQGYGYSAGAGSGYYHRTTQEEYMKWDREAEAKFQESLRANRMWLLKWVTFAVVFIAASELYVIFEAAGQKKIELDKLSEEVRHMHVNALLNYDQGNTMDDRINRFVAHRQRTLENNPNRSYAGITKSAGHVIHTQDTGTGTGTGTTTGTITGTPSVGDTLDKADHYRLPVLRSDKESRDQ